MYNWSTTSRLTVPQEWGIVLDDISFYQIVDLGDGTDRKLVFIILQNGQQVEIKLSISDVEILEQAFRGKLDTSQ